VLSWTQVRTALVYTVQTGASVGGLTQAVRVVGTRYGEAAAPPRTRFYRVRATLDAARPVTERIHVDQFGYLPDAEKIAVISNPREGFNAQQSFRPATNLEVRSAPDGETVFRSAPLAWQGGAVHGEATIRSGRSPCRPLIAFASRIMGRRS